MSVNEMYTVKLVANPDNKRAKLFSELISVVGAEYKVQGPINLVYDIEADYNVFFDTDVCQSRHAASEIADLKGKTITIFDVSEDSFLSDKIGGLQTLSCVCAKFITCANEHMQECVYDNTGRLAAIVGTPVNADDFHEADTKAQCDVGDLDIYWFGSLIDIFSVKSLTLNKKYNIMAGTTTIEKIHNRNLNKSDIVFFPKTYNTASEFARLAKVEECIIKGKFVAAPDLEFDYEGLAFDGDIETTLAFYMEADINTWIKAKQKILRESEGMDNSINQLVFAFSEAPSDEFSDNLETTIETDHI